MPWFPQGPIVSETKLRCALFGSSTIAACTTNSIGGLNESADGFWAHMQGRMGSPFVLAGNYGVNGSTSPSIVGSIPGKTGLYDIGFIQLGGNDLIVGTITAAQALSYLETALTNNWANGAVRAVVCIPFARLAADGWTNYIYTQLVAYRNGVLAISAADSRVSVIDFADALRDPSSAIGESLAAVLTTWHLNILGASIVGEYAANTLSSLAAWAKWDGLETSKGTLVSVSPTLETGWSQLNANKVANSIGGATLRTTSTTGYTSQAIAKDIVATDKMYRLCLDATAISNCKYIAIYFRNNTSTYKWSVGLDTASTPESGFLGGSRAMYVSAPFAIPKAVYDAAISFTFGVQLSVDSGTACAHIRRAALVETP